MTSCVFTLVFWWWLVPPFLLGMACGLLARRPENTLSFSLRWAVPVALTADLVGTATPIAVSKPEIFPDGSVLVLYGDGHVKKHASPPPPIVRELGLPHRQGKAVRKELESVEAHETYGP